MADASTKPSRKGRKRAAESSPSEKGEKPSKKAATTMEKAAIYYVPGLPAPGKPAMHSAVSGLVVAHSEDAAKGILFDTFCARHVKDEVTQERATRQVEDWFASALEVDMSSPKFWRVTNGPPPVLQNKAPSDERTKSGAKRLFVVKHFQENIMFPGVALVVAPDRKSAQLQVEAYTSKYKSVTDNRPPKIASEVGPFGEIQEIDLNVEAFYPLVDGQPYSY